MLTAKEALVLVQESSVAMDRRMVILDHIVTEAAMLEKREVWPDMALPHDTDYRVDYDGYSTAEMTPVQRLVKDKLTKLGFMFKIEYRNTQISGGLGSMDDEIVFTDLPYLVIR